MEEGSKRSMIRRFRSPKKEKSDISDAIKKEIGTFGSHKKAGKRLRSGENISPVAVATRLKNGCKVEIRLQKGCNKVAQPG